MEIDHTMLDWAMICDRPWFRPSVRPIAWPLFLGPVALDIPEPPRQPLDDLDHELPVGHGQPADVAIDEFDLLRHSPAAFDQEGLDSALEHVGEHEELVDAGAGDAALDPREGFLADLQPLRNLVLRVAGGLASPGDRLPKALVHQLFLRLRHAFLTLRVNVDG